jgi:hypothetical protein
MSRLPLLLRERSLEPGHGVLLRLGARNGYSSARRFATSLGLEFRKVLTGSAASHLAEMAGLKPQPILDCSPMMVSGRKVALCGEELDLRDWTTSHRRYCPACHAFDRERAHSLKLDPAWYASHRSIWDVASIDACPLHGIQLCAQCFRCGEPLGWRKTNILVCSHCQSDLSAAPCNLINDPFGAYMACRLSGQPCENEILNLLPLQSVLNLCERLGQIQTVGAAKSLPRQSLAMQSQSRSIGIGMSLDLERALTSAFDTVLARRSGAAQGLLGAYGWIYGEWLSIDDGYNDRMRSILFSHAVGNGVISADEPVLGNAPRKTISMKEAARTLGMGHDRARAFAVREGIIPEGSRHGVAFTLDPLSIAKLDASVREDTPLREAAIRLETSNRQVAKFVEMRLLMQSDCRNVISASITRLLDSLIAQCTAQARADNLLCVSTAARNASVPLWRIVRAVQHGTIPCWKDSGGGLSQFAVQLRDVIQLRVARRELSVEAAARRIGVHHDCARAMARHGVILEGNGLLTHEAISRFEREYVVGSRIAQDRGCSPRALHRKLLTSGILPAFDLSTHRQAIYRRSELSALGWPYAS